MVRVADSYASDLGLIPAQVLRFFWKFYFVESIWVPLEINWVHRTNVTPGSELVSLHKSSALHFSSNVNKFGYNEHSLKVIYTERERTQKRIFFL